MSSIGLPAFEGENDLVELLEMALTQGFADFELVISDNVWTGSPRDIRETHRGR